MTYKEIIKKFRLLYPNGFEDEKWKEGEKKHKVEKINNFVDHNISKEIFEDYLNPNQTGKIVELIGKLVGMSSIVSMFEKMAFRNFANEANNDLIDEFAVLVTKFLYGGNFEDDFTNFSIFLGKNKDLGKNTNIAKWTFMTSILSHVKRDEEISIKPTSLKSISQKLEKPIYYTSIPNVKTYIDYKKIVLEFKEELSKELNPKDNIITQAVLYICCL